MSEIEPSQGTESKIEFNYIDKLKTLILEPIVFFRRVKLETNIWSSSIMILIFSLIFSIISLFINMTYYRFGNLLSTLILYGLSFKILFFIGLVLAYSVIINLLSMIFRKKGTFIDSYNVVAYSLLPAIILGAIPLIGWIIGYIYSLVLIIIGMSKVHNISGWKSTLVCLIPIIAFIGFFAFIFMMFWNGIFWI